MSIDAIVQFLGLDPLKAPKLIGGALMLLWALSFSVILALVKTLSPSVDNITILFVRYLCGLIFYTPFLMRTGLSSFKTSHPLLHIIRIVTLASATLCAYYAYRHLPLVLATSIGMSAPLFTSVLSIILLGESVSWKKWGLIIFGYLGVLVMVRPDEVSIVFAVWIALCANLSAGLTIITVKVLSKTESTSTLLVYINTFMTILAGIGALSIWTTPSLYDFIILLTIGALGLVSQYSLITALKYANPSYLAPLEYTRMCFAIPVGYFFFGEIPDFWVLFGSAMIISATYLLTKLELFTSSRQ